MVALKPKSTLSQPTGDVTSYDLAFMEGNKAARTLVFELCPAPATSEQVATKESCSVYIDVDENNLPVAISFVHHKDAKLEYQKCGGQEEAMKVATELYEFAKELVDQATSIEKMIAARQASAKQIMRERLESQVQELTSEACARLTRLEGMHRKTAGRFLVRS